MQRIGPLLPAHPDQTGKAGRRWLDDRQELCGILFVLYTGIHWEYLPAELGFGSGMTCWRRLRDWNAAGVWQRLHELLLAELRGAGALDFSRAAVDSSHLRAMKSGPAPAGPRWTGTRPAASTTWLLKATVSRWPRPPPEATATTSPSCFRCCGPSRRCAARTASPPMARPGVRRPGLRPRQRPPAGGETGITPVIARRGTDDGSLGVHRWVVEAAFALLQLIPPPALFCRAVLGRDNPEGAGQGAGVAGLSGVRPGSGRLSVV